jgi:nitrogen regulatory protein P-II 1
MIDDSKIDKLKSAIANVACTNLKGDGKIFVSDVEDAFDICSGGSGKDAL